MIGRIHSIETFGTVDGPGVRFVLFMQGCALQCRYCHNPDTWDQTIGKRMTVDQVLAEIEPYVSYYKPLGGITVSGGEPTLQAPFVADLFQACKEKWGLHTALDSSGFCDPYHARHLLAHTDLVLLDLKHINEEKHINLTTQTNQKTLAFARHLSDIKKKVWIRHVLVPGYTDDENDLKQLGYFIGSLSNVEKIEILPYHQMGVYKWQQLGKNYTLEDIQTPTDDEVNRAYACIERGKEMYHHEQKIG
ncbi:pyruvate formate-lyase-activating protein [Longirhabdus pacifica]|uniref:pyruvate formate-lyase-activating protein n=1 Tax=Longirhabdus pacifica TaxID=2305227 RepID=UPI001008C94E|nr:pyruvate formate-lyase-activating protein [Longirhabdus pacifica]